MDKKNGIDSNQEKIEELRKAVKDREPKFEELEKARREATERIRKGDA
jgi:hypothetical protein